jgi:putative intracellular protease/amidase
MTAMKKPAGTVPSCRPTGHCRRVERRDCSALLILPGAPSWDEGANEPAVALARRFLDAGVPVAAICGATAGLARAGLLNDRPHTSNAAEYLAGLSGYAGAAHYRDEPCEAGGDLITAGGTAPLDFARAILARLEVYAPPVLDVWYALYAKGYPSGFYALQAAAP